MFDYEKLLAYQKALQVYEQIKTSLLKRGLNIHLRDQLQRAAISMVINIAEGCGKGTRIEKSRFFVISRASGYECASLLDLLRLDLSHHEELLLSIKKDLYEFTRIISGLIKSFDSRKIPSDSV